VDLPLKDSRCEPNIKSQLELTSIDQNRSTGSNLHGGEMIEQEPATRTMKISDVKATLSSLVNEVYRQETRVLVEKAGIPVAALVSVQDLQRLAQAEREERFAVVDQMRKAFKDVPAEEIERNVVAIIREMREANEASIKPEEQVAVERRPA
jgi:prevent-host-death family protein